MKARLVTCLIGGALFGLAIQYLILAVMASRQEVDFCPTMMKAWPLFVFLGVGLGAMARSIRMVIKCNREEQREEAAQDPL